MSALKVTINGPTQPSTKTYTHDGNEPISFPTTLSAEVPGYATGMLWVEDVSDVRKYNMIFDHLEAAALSFDESVALMTSVLKDL